MLSVQHSAHAFPTSEIFIKTYVQTISSFLNLSCSQHDLSTLNNFGQHHNNFSDYSEFFSNFTIAISCQQSLQTTISLHSNTTLSANSEFSSNFTTSFSYQQFLPIMSKIPLKPSALYRQQKKNPPPGLESLVISNSSSHQKSKKIRAMEN